MTWQEKMRRLTEGKNLSYWSRRAGCPRNAISNALNSNQMPRSDKGVKLAKALKVTADWLFDDEQDRPSPVGTGAESHEGP